MHKISRSPRLRLGVAYHANTHTRHSCIYGGRSPGKGWEKYASTDLQEHGRSLHRGLENGSLLVGSRGRDRVGRLKMQDLDNAGPGKCLGSKMPDFVAKNQQIFIIIIMFVVELYNYLEQVTYQKHVTTMC